jgi:predicted RNase H-like nuclease (RuvC/YqgF family)
MPPSGLPTGTVSSGRRGPSIGDGGDDEDARARVAELERENEALRAAVEQQRQENERIVERYERLLERERACGGESTASESQSPTSLRDRLARALGRRF